MPTQLAPYPGLRPFTESESIYFRGREKHIAEIQDLLGENHYLMVTGASGDGKSSLIFAGVLPNVRAGFFKGVFPRWNTAIFRPGHQPLNSLVSVLATALAKDTEALKKNLGYGYSALIDEYKNSDCYCDVDSKEYSELASEQQKELKKKSRNLLIVVDQFEEFFTTSENFDKETAIPSVEAQLVMNLLIETAHVARKEKLPIYIVCTMRSDYIGNAPSYRGLPELVGSFQFFVPRLNRQEIEEVIEEPANLNGNAVSKRLAQRLINDLDVVNTDVLPSLQHALRRIWEAANKGADEMDLVHYAMVGGMPKTELEVLDQEKFIKWHDELPIYHQALLSFENRGVSNVLNVHADLLYEQLTFEYVGELRKRIGDIFKCLTQIDDGKAVRNRMILSDIQSTIGAVLSKDKEEVLLLSISIIFFKEKPSCFNNLLILQPCLPAGFLIL